MNFISNNLLPVKSKNISIEAQRPQRWLQTRVRSQKEHHLLLHEPQTDAVGETTTQLQ